LGVSIGADKSGFGRDTEHLIAVVLQTGTAAASAATKALYTACIPFAGICSIESGRERIFDAVGRFPGCSRSTTIFLATAG